MEVRLGLRLGGNSTIPCLAKKDSLNFFGGPARIRTGDRQVSRTWGYEPAALSVLQPEENLAELRALQESRSLNSILNVLVVRNSPPKL